MNTPSFQRPKSILNIILHNTYLLKMAMNRSFFIILHTVSRGLQVCRLIIPLKFDVWNPLWVTLTKSLETFHLSKSLDIKLVKLPLD